MVKSGNIGDKVKVTNRQCVYTRDIGMAQKTECKDSGLTENNPMRWLSRS